VFWIRPQTQAWFSSNSLEEMREELSDLASTL
jgi:hypothetical protein